MRAREQRARLQPGQVVADGRYVLLGELGRGGLATVFRATDARDGAVVALKVLCDRYVGRPEREERLRREFEYARRVEHPAVVEVGELGTLEDGRPFFSMELVEGQPLSRIISGSGGLPFPQMRRLARAIAVALDAVHRAGIVHRDVKPENVLVLDDDRVKLIDFGMAGDEDAPAVPAGHTARLTRVNDLLGTHEYMAPEQVLKAPPQRAMDVFALGVVMYEMLSSITPYSGMGVREYVELQTAGDPFVRSAERWARIKEAPAALGELIDDCRRRAPEERPGDMLEIVRRLDELEGLTTSAPAITAVAVAVRPELRPVPLVGAGSQGAGPAARRGSVAWAAVLAAAALIVLWRWSGAEEPATEGPTSAPQLAVAAVDQRDGRVPPAAVGAPDVVAPRVPELAPTRAGGDSPSVEVIRSQARRGHIVTAGQEPRPPAGSDEDERQATRRAPRRRANEAQRQRTRPEAASAQPVPSPTEAECKHAMAAARAAFATYRWEAVLAHTTEPLCWSEHKAEHVAMRTEALMEEGHWAECVRTGKRSADPRVRRFAERCQKRLDTIASTP